jgi:hypothetical protein
MSASYKGKGKGKLRHNPERRAEYAAYAASLIRMESISKETIGPKLDMRNIDLEDADAAAILKDIVNSDFVELDLRGNWLTDATALVLAEVLPDTKVRYLNLENNCIGMEGMAAVFSVLAESQVEYMWVGGNQGVCDGRNKSQLMNMLPERGAAFRICFESKTKVF